MRAEQADPGLFDRAYGGADAGAFRKLDGVVRDALADAGGAGAKLPPGGAGQVRSDGECDEDGNVGPSSLKPRVPSKDGSWTGEPGNSGWQSSLPEAAAATGGKPIPYVNGRPDFTQWASMSVNLPAGALTGYYYADLSAAQKHLAGTGKPEFQSVAALKEYLEANDLTMHHATDTCVQIVPKAINEVPHIGSAADVKHQRSLGWTPSTP